MSSGQKVFLYWLLFFLLWFGLYLANITEYIVKKIIALYLLIGVFISFKYKITIFKKGKFSDPIEGLDEMSIIANISILIISLYVLIFD